MNGADKKELVQMIDKVVTKRVDEVVTKRVDEIVTKRVDEVVSKRVSASESRIIEDMKQSTTTIVSQQADELRKEMSEMEKRLDGKISDLSGSVGEALDISNSVTEDQVKDHEDRIIRLEQKIA